MAALDNTALKSLSKCSFTLRKLRFSERFRLVLSSFAYFVDVLYEGDCANLLGLCDVLRVAFQRRQRVRAIRCFTGVTQHFCQG